MRRPRRPERIALPDRLGMTRHGGRLHYAVLSAARRKLSIENAKKAIVVPVIVLQLLESGDSHDCLLI
ncbi:hypothetical protein GCM10007159_39810 [Modicisalibacter luteus]|nr:hypothetical protein GCM10007159_39810 [Halomonas lutea]